MKSELKNLFQAFGLCLALAVAAETYNWNYKMAPYNPWKGAAIGTFKTPSGVIMDEKENKNELIRLYNLYNRDAAIGCYTTRTGVINCE